MNITHIHIYATQSGAKIVCGDNSFQKSSRCFRVERETVLEMLFDQI